MEKEKMHLKEEMDRNVMKTPLSKYEVRIND